MRACGPAAHPSGNTSTTHWPSGRCVTALGAGAPPASSASARSRSAQVTGSQHIHSSPMPTPYEPFAASAACAASLLTCARASPVRPTPLRRPHSSCAPMLLPVAGRLSAYSRFSTQLRPGGVICRQTISIQPLLPSTPARRLWMPTLGRTAMVVRSVSRSSAARSAVPRAAQACFLLSSDSKMACSSASGVAGMAGKPAGAASRRHSVAINRRFGCLDNTAMAGSR